MENVLAGRLQSVEFGAVQRYKNMVIVPLTADGSFRYRALCEAVDTSDELLHSAFFQIAAPSRMDSQRMASLGNRRRYYRE